VKYLISLISSDLKNHKSYNVGIKHAHSRYISVTNFVSTPTSHSKLWLLQSLS